MQQHALISSCEIKTDPKVGPTCIITLVRGAQLSFRLCEDKLFTVSRMGYASRDEFRIACALAGSELRKELRSAPTKVVEGNQSSSAKTAPNRKLWYREET